MAWVFPVISENKSSPLDKRPEGCDLLFIGHVAFIRGDDLRPRRKFRIEIFQLRVDRLEIFDRVAPFHS